MNNVNGKFSANFTALVQTPDTGGLDLSEDPYRLIFCSVSLWECPAYLTQNRYRLPEYTSC